MISSNYSLNKYLKIYFLLIKSKIKMTKLKNYYKKFHKIYFNIKFLKNILLNKKY